MALGVDKPMAMQCSCKGHSKQQSAHAGTPDGINLHQPAVLLSAAPPMFARDSSLTLQSMEADKGWQRHMSSCASPIKSTGGC